MRIGIFYNALLCALKNGEIESIEKGMSQLARKVFAIMKYLRIPFAAKA